jgi:hypothetical protein
MSITELIYHLIEAISKDLQNDCGNKFIVTSPYSILHKMFSFKYKYWF